jgi:hypothetical protein
MYATDIDSESVPVVQVPARLQTHSAKRPTVSELLRRLDSQGITESQYQALSIVKCECGMIVTQKAFDTHTCIVDLSEREDF